MNNLDKNNQPTYKNNGVDQKFEQNAGVKILKGKENYGGGSGFYASKSKRDCPNVNDGGSCDTPSKDQPK